MHLIAIHHIADDKREILPDEDFEASKEEAQRLIELGAAKEKKSKKDMKPQASVGETKGGQAPPPAKPK